MRKHGQNGLGNMFGAAMLRADFSETLIGLILCAGMRTRRSSAHDIAFFARQWQMFSSRAPN
jgi:hypothetical protein